MSKASNTKTRIPRTPEFKKQAIALANEIAVPFWADLPRSRVKNRGPIRPILISIQ